MHAFQCFVFVIDFLLGRAQNAKGILLHACHWFLPYLKHRLVFAGAVRLPHAIWRAVVALNIEAAGLVVSLGTTRSAAVLQHCLPSPDELCRVLHVAPAPRDDASSAPRQCRAVEPGESEGRATELGANGRRTTEAGAFAPREGVPALRLGLASEVELDSFVGAWEGGVLPLQELLPRLVIAVQVLLHREDTADQTSA